MSDKYDPSQSPIGKVAGYIAAAPGWTAVFCKTKNGNVVEDVEGGRSSIYTVPITQWAVVPTVSGGLFDIFAAFDSGKNMAAIVPCGADGVLDSEHGAHVLHIVPPGGTIEKALTEIREREKRLEGRA